MALYKFIYLLTYLLTYLQVVAAWCIGCALVSINEGAPHRARLLYLMSWMGDILQTSP